MDTSFKVAIIFEILMETKLNNDISRLVILTKNVKSLVLTHKIPICSISTTINCDLQRCYNGNKDFFFNWDSPHARLNSHYEAWSYKKKKAQKRLQDAENLFRKNLQLKDVC